MFFDQARKLSTQPLLWSRYRKDESYHSISWKKVADQVLKITGGLMENGVGDGDRVVIISENKPEWFIADLAIITCGAITVPAYTTYTTNDYLFILNHCKAKGIIVSSRNLAE